MTETDYIIVGQGIAGTAVSYELLRRRRRVQVFDVPKSNSSSRIAAGIFNPVTGRGAVKTWKADMLFPFLKSFYGDMERFLEARFLYIKHGVRFFRSSEERNRIFAKSADPGPGKFIDTETDASIYENIFKANLGYFKIRESGYLEISALLDQYRNFLLNNSLLHEERLDTELLQFEPDAVVYKNIKARKIIFCEGTTMTANPFFRDLPLTPVKGELIDIRAEGIPEDRIYHAGIFILPRGNNTYTVGATYDRMHLNCEPTEAGKEELCRQLDAVLKVPYEVIGHRAGIRPAVRDRRPLIGPHPDLPNAVLFNGLGTKGVSLAPLLASRLADYLENNEELFPETKIDRYFLGKLPRKSDINSQSRNL